MSKLAISLNNVSKCFKRYGRPLDRLKEILLPGKSRADEFWALRNINLEVTKGQTLGIVGRNGSGKSTLLQIIVNTLTPTTGEVQVNGRVSALLELGSGFNPEFTGRQNVFFNGQLLGLPPKEIEAKFDQIAAFADIGDFIDQPVKTYSSGMFVRLAFAVATSVEPDILVVDEALSVGDEAFQRKCSARIQTIQERGGTVLFVSHSANSVIELCTWAILMDHGELLLSGNPKLVLSNYHKLIYAPAEQVESLRQEVRRLNHQTTVNQTETPKPSKTVVSSPIANLSAYYDPNLIPKSTISYVSQGAEIEQPHITTLDAQKVNILTRRSNYIYTYRVKFSETAYKVRFGMLIKTVSGLELSGGLSHIPGDGIECVAKGQVIKVEFRFRCLLRPGVYFLNSGVVGRTDTTDATEIFLARKIDLAMFRVQPDQDMEDLGYGLVDLYVEPKLSDGSLEETGNNSSNRLIEVVSLEGG
jgi:lipopolysaccharide transport system ATP-binding protein